MDEITRHQLSSDTITFNIKQLAKTLVHFSDQWDEALSIIRSAQNNAVYETAREFIRKVDGNDAG